MIIKDKMLKNDDPYVKCCVVSQSDCPGATYYLIKRACDSLMDELGFRFKIDFQPECCILKACKIVHEDDLQKFRARYNYARASQ